tara:strand:- start:919 stop:1083 length:165 start_codon:yes stop_codon:yes gene_type:complete
MILLAVLAATSLHLAEYKLGPDSQRKAGVPRGEVTAGKWTSKGVFPGTLRDYWV